MARQYPQPARQEWASQPIGRQATPSTVCFNIWVTPSASTPSRTAGLVGGDNCRRDDPRPASHRRTPAGEFFMLVRAAASFRTPRAVTKAGEG